MTVHPAALQVLADPKRFAIVEILAKGERSVNGLAAELGIDQSGVSRHLQVLRDAGLVKVRADGPHRMHYLSPDPMKELDEWVGRFRAHWDARFDRLEDHIAKKRSQS